MKYRVCQTKHCDGAKWKTWFATIYDDINMAHKRCIRLNETKKHEGWSGTSTCYYARTIGSQRATCKAEFEVREAI